MAAAARPTFRALRRSVVPSLIIAAICAVWSLASQVPVMPTLKGPVLLGPDGLLSFVENPTIDARFSFRGTIPSPLKIVYVDVDNGSLKALGNFPWNRAIFAETINALFDRGKIRAVGFDFIFSETGLPQLGRAEAEQGSLALGRSVRDQRAVVLAATYGSQQVVLDKRRGFPFLFNHRITKYDAELPELPSFPVVGPAWGTIGLIDVAKDDVRNVPMFAQTRDQTYFAMALQLALLHYGLPESSLGITSDAITAKDEAGHVIMRIPLWLQQFVEPNWFSPWKSASENPRASLVTVMEVARVAADGTDEDKAKAAKFFSQFNDAIVLIGPTDAILKDTSPAPLNEGVVPRVSLHGNLLKTIVGQRYLRRPPIWANVAIIVLVALAVSGLAVANRVRVRRQVRLLAAVVAVGYVGVAFLLFFSADLILPIVAPLGAAICCSLYGVAAKLSLEEKRRQRIKNLFGNYVSSVVVNKLVEDDILPQTGGAEVEITAFFSDIAAFTTLSEQLSPSELVDLMCEYLGEVTSAITLDGGTLDKYVGDAVIAMFGAPLPRADHAAAACRAALAAQEAQAKLRERWTQSGRRLPAEVLSMHTRIGLNTGLAVVGNIGSPLRFNYTMMGSAVNLTQRLESAGSHYGVGIIVSSATATAASRDDRDLVFRPLDRILVAGQQEAVDIFELIGRGEDARRANQARLEAYASARQLYLEGRWIEAGEAFLAASPLEISVGRKNPSLVMASRCETFALEGKDGPTDFSVPKH